MPNFERLNKLRDVMLKGIAWKKKYDVMDWSTCAYGWTNDDETFWDEKLRGSYPHYQGREHKPALEVFFDLTWEQANSLFMEPRTPMKVVENIEQIMIKSDQSPPARPVFVVWFPRIRRFFCPI